MNNDLNDLLKVHEEISQGGPWLSAARTWMQSNVPRGDTLTWGSREPVMVPFAALEELARKVAVAAVMHERANQANQSKDMELVAWDVYEQRKYGPSGDKHHRVLWVEHYKLPDGSTPDLDNLLLSARTGETSGGKTIHVKPLYTKDVAFEFTDAMIAKMAKALQVDEKYVRTGRTPSVTGYGDEKPRDNHPTHSAIPLLPTTASAVDPDECAAKSGSCEREPCGPKGEIQCKHCGG